MTNEEKKQLLLIDLCARLPYGLKVKCEKYSFPVTILYAGNVDEVKFKETGGIEHIYAIKSYLRSLSSMTEEEKSEYLDIKKGECDGCVLTGKGDPNTEFMLVDFYNKHHLDYRGLIPMGLALEAKEGMYKIK